MDLFTASTGHQQRHPRVGHATAPAVPGVWPARAAGAGRRGRPGEAGNAGGPAEPAVYPGAAG